jgi:hypothetical protein
LTHWLARWWRDIAALPPPWAPAGPPPDDPGQLGAAAKRLLEDPVLHLALERIDRKLIETWKITDPGQVEAREAVFWQYKAVERFKGELQQMVGSAAMSGRPE